MMFPVGGYKCMIPSHDPYWHRILGMCDSRNRHAYRHVIYRFAHGDGGSVMLRSARWEESQGLELVLTW